MTATPRQKKNRTARLSTGLSRHASTVSFATARALTSHARRIYRERYEGRYRYAQLLYAFDLFLVGVGATLVCVSLFFMFHGPVSDSGLGLVFTAPQIRASDSTPLSAVVSVTDGEAHADLRLGWALPSWAEIVRANPPIEKDGTVHLGDIRPGQSVRSDLLIRVRALPGTSIPITFALSQFGLFGQDRVSGIERRIAGPSVLTATPGTSARSAVPSASVPFLVTNAGNDPVPAATFRLVKHAGAAGARVAGSDAVYLGMLAGHETRVVFVDLGTPEADTVTLGWQLQDGAQVVDAHERDFRIASADQAPAGPDGEIVHSAGIPRLHITAPAAFHGSLFVARPSSDVAAPYVVIPSAAAVDVALDGSPTSTGSWDIVPVADADGGIIGRRISGRISSRIPFRASARYYSAAGDQIGVGPLPPKVGEATTYWIVWSVGPTDTSIRDLHITAALSDHVIATGRSASSFGGIYANAADAVTWDIPMLASTAGQVATFAFEVHAVPSASAVGKAMPLIGSSRVSGIDVRSGDTLRSSVDAVTTDLIDDEKAGGKGTVVSGSETR